MDVTDPMFETYRDEFLELMFNISLSRDAEDSYFWMLLGEGFYSVYSCYTLFLVEEGAMSVFQEDVVKALNNMWKIEAPTKLIFFGWRVLLNRIATKDQLYKHSILTEPNDTKCVFCLSHEESVSHIFRSCTFAD